MRGIVKKLWYGGAKSFQSETVTDIPKGHVRVYVGKDMLFKFEMEANYLNHPLFENLLKLSEEEFGYSYDVALRIACEVDLFHYLLHLLKNSNPSAHYTEFPDLIPSFIPKMLPLNDINSLSSTNFENFLLCFLDKK